MEISQKQLDLEHSCSFISLREIPQAQCLTHGLLATFVIGERHGHYPLEYLRTEIGTVLANPGL
jgi:hypothetical protein